MLNAAGAGIGVLAAGIVVKNAGTKALTESEICRVEVDKEIAELHNREELLRGARQWAREQGEVLDTMRLRATGALDNLEAEPFDAELHAERFQLALLLVTSVGQILASFYDYVNQDGTEHFTFEFRDATREATDD